MIEIPRLTLSKLIVRDYYNLTLRAVHRADFQVQVHENGNEPVRYIFGFGVFSDFGFSNRVGSGLVMFGFGHVRVWSSLGLEWALTTFFTKMPFFEFFLTFVMYFYQNKIIYMNIPTFKSIIVELFFVRHFTQKL